jgi:hypothetical protein
MSNYKGYLLKFGNTIMPNGYFNEFSSTPNQRMEAAAERDQLGDLHRSTLLNYKSSISFSTHILFLEEKINFQNIINSSIINVAQRKCKVTYWNDETNSYSSGYFYIPDIEFSIMDADANGIKYNPITVELIEC